MLRDYVCSVSLLGPKVILLYACSSRIEDLSAISLTLPFAYNHMCFLESDLVRLLLVSADDYSPLVV